MNHEFRATWDAVAWQRYALMLVQMRHGGQNVQRVPDKVQGDAGLEFFTYDRCLYQCYAPQDPTNTSKTASAVKQKATRDLGKLEKNKAVLEGLLSGLSFDRWILFCPTLDDKSVITHVRAKGAQICALTLPYISPTFEALVQCHEDFAAEIAKLRELPVGPDLQVASPADDDIAVQPETSLIKTLDGKLVRAYPNTTPDKRENLRKIYVRNHVKRGNTLEALKASYPDLWERAVQTIGAEEMRLEILGASGTAAPAERLRESLNRIEDGLRKDLPTVAQATINDLSSGTLSDWLMRCPLDFDGDA